MDLSPAELMEGAYASEETLHSSVAFLRNTLTGLGFCRELNLLSQEPGNVVSTCNTIYGLLLQHQRDARYREQLKQDMHRMKLEVAAADKERGRLEGRLSAKEREIGALSNKARAAGEQQREDLKAARKEAEELQKKVTGFERRVVQLQHEMKRKEREFERLQERLSHLLSDKRKSEKAVLDMAGKLTQQLAGGGGRASVAARAGAGARSDEGLKAVVAAYEAKQTELGKENKDLKAALASLQAEYKEMLNRQVRQQQADASSSSAAAAAAADDSFLQSVPSMSEEELRAELGARVKQLQRRSSNLASLTAGEADCTTPGEQRLFRDLQAQQSVIQDQERLLTAALASLRASQKAKESQHQADMRRMAQHYQAQLAAAEGEIQRAREEQAATAQSEVDALRTQLEEVRAAVAARSAAESAAAETRATLERQLAAAQAEAGEAQQRAGAAAVDVAREREGRAAAEAAAEARATEQAAALEGERAELAAAQAAAAQERLRFELLKKNYEALMRQYAPGLGAGVFLERAVARKATELTDLEMQDSAAAGDTIAAVTSAQLAGEALQPGSGKRAKKEDKKEPESFYLKELERYRKGSCDAAGGDRPLVNPSGARSALSCLPAAPCLALSVSPASIMVWELVATAVAGLNAGSGLQAALAGSATSASTDAVGFARFASRTRMLGLFLSTVSTSACMAAYYGESRGPLWLAAAAGVGIGVPFNLLLMSPPAAMEVATPGARLEPYGLPPVTESPAAEAGLAGAEAGAVGGSPFEGAAPSGVLSAATAGASPQGGPPRGRRLMYAKSGMLVSASDLTSSWAKRCWFGAALSSIAFGCMMAMLGTGLDTTTFGYAPY
ncbi:afadin alpha-actinin-binding [Micractinium conductrix]|uniref:Afadin alpha-actinin-binding n=1 Tax=Micractinium conductrix TaxID=554055 RepID=A0A2P6V000_9CHLO|nr:afadin alpha-actinin-binding [Micractinium conductrix]|eukprot:PSC67427.1 afadin alpha-actinin-binding [Micractinium conductrix]